MSTYTDYWFAPRHFRIKFNLITALRIASAILAACAIIGLPYQFWIEHDSLRGFVVGVTVADYCWALRLDMLDWVKAEHDEPPSRAMLIRLIAVALLRTLWSVLTVCALVRFPQQVWIKFESERWFVIGAMLPDGFWALLLASARFAEDHRQPPAPRRILAGRVAHWAVRVDWFILAVCALLGFPRQLWNEFEPWRWIVIGGGFGDLWWFLPAAVAQLGKDAAASRAEFREGQRGDSVKGLPQSRRVMMFAAGASFRLLWFILTISALIGFPQHLWTEYDPMRWIVVGAMLGDFWWSLPRALGERWKGDEAPRGNSC